MRKTSQAFSFPDDHQILGDEEVLDDPVADERSEREEKVAGTQTQLSEDIEEEEEEEDVDDGDEDAQKTFLIVVEKPAPSNIYE